ncbi:MAG TPA: hypothetical protein VGE97_06640 [Nitrososphaera sp.]|jgi:hypothetical protein
MTRKFQRNSLEEAFEELESLRRDIGRLINRKEITLPFRDASNLPPGIEGQVVLADEGGTSILTNAGVYEGEATTSGGGHTFPWTHLSGNDPMDLSNLEFGECFHPTVFVTGVYAFTVSVAWTGDMPGLIDPVYHGPAWFTSYIALDPASVGIDVSSGSAGATDTVFQSDTSVGSPRVEANLCCTWFLPISAIVSVFIEAPSVYDFSFRAFVQQVA